MRPFASTLVLAKSFQTCSQQFNLLAHFEHLCASYNARRKVAWDFASTRRRSQDLAMLCSQICEYLHCARKFASTSIVLKVLRVPPLCQKFCLAWSFTSFASTFVLANQYFIIIFNIIIFTNYYVDNTLNKIVMQ